MADRNINLSIRKPRRTKGTPSYRQRNILAFGVLFLGASCWTLFEFWSQTKKLKKSIIEGKLAYSQEVKDRLIELQLGFDPDLTPVLEHMRQKKYAETPRKQSWLSKLLASSPDFKTSENISTYFVKATPPVRESPICQSAPARSSSVVSEAPPYQNIMAEVIEPLLNDSMSEKDNFKSAEPRLVTRTTTVKSSCVKVQKTKRPKQITITRLMEKQFCYGDTNGEHLQLAMALSRSLEDLKRPRGPEENGEVPTALRGNTILERFGFNSGRKSGAGSKITTGDVFKKRNKSRYQYITPVLFLRTDEDRERIISAKVSLILSQNGKPEVGDGGSPEQPTPLPCSSYLRELNGDGVYKLNRLTREELRDKKRFYLSDLNVPPSTCPGGFLLRDWGGISGRQATPPRDDVKETEPGDVFDGSAISPDHRQVEAGKEDPPSCTSPNLFDSDDDDCVVVSSLNKSIDEQLQLSQRLINNFNSRTNSFNEADKENHPSIHDRFDSNHVDGVATDLGEAKIASDVQCNSSGLKRNSKQESNVAQKTGDGGNFFDLTDSSDDDEGGKRWERVSTSQESDSSDCEVEIYCVKKSEGVSQRNHSSKSEADVKSSQESIRFEDGGALSDLNPSSGELQNEIHPILACSDCEWGFGDGGGVSRGKINLCSPLSSRNSSDDALSISDEELNYSSLYAGFANKSLVNLEDSIHEEEEEEERDTALSSESNAENPPENDGDHHRPDHVNFDFDVNRGTPESRGRFKSGDDDDLIIKIGDVTPVPNYAQMDTPGIAEELRKFGIKNLKRRRGVQILNYIYDSTHPLVSARELGDGGANPAKKPRRKLEAKYDEEERGSAQRIELVGDLLRENESDLIFETKRSSKVSSCRMPLHIAWYNLVASHPQIRESILLYEPLQLEVLCSLLKEQGHKYSAQDLLTFLDKKCVTVRTNQNQRNANLPRIKTKRKRNPAASFSSS